MRRTCLAILILLAASARAEVSRRTPIVDAVEKAMPSVVNIGTERLVQRYYTNPRMRQRFDLFDLFARDFLFSLPPTPGYTIKHSLGSGVVVHPDGYILTNFHVVERASRIRVMFADESIYDARLLVGDELNDLALIKVDPPEPLPAVSFATDDDLLLGETVIALGNPFGLAHTVTVGVLSAKNREARHDGQVLYRDILQTDAAVNPGNSGGPLLNIHGDMIGVNVAIYQEGQNIGFAIPIRRARELLNRWLTPRVIKKEWIGFEVADQDGQLVVGNLGDTLAALPDGPRPGDLLLEVNGEPVEDMFRLNTILLTNRPDDAIALRLNRGGEDLTATVRLEPLPKPSGEKLARERLGLVFVSAKDREPPLPDRFQNCLVIGEVLPDSPAERAGLKPDMIVTTLNDLEITCQDDVGTALENTLPGDPVTVQIVSLIERETFLIAQTTSLDLRAN